MTGLYIKGGQSLLGDCRIGMKKKDKAFSFGLVQKLLYLIIASKL